MASLGAPFGLLIAITREEYHTFDTSDQVVASENFTSENIIFSPNIPEYKPRGSLKIQDAIEHNAAQYRIGGF